ncbi:3-keto-5-aminohexanoate cleavage protein [Methylocella sp. CPCC 101449]|uniref:3-keto-5-aminohexanoate cleavage protein n=1 Tax=Methylocella sp. CPCC 101449 TaxID=2987531 RepID=UPI002890A151|nr:3-keto-5-aminohexanoate cleavage protein [Methylocella sp. CPCC 101449]MDT2020557.1 3-keto-5-aminohexanoate cleavage protein [Methylocella sp. CPCC 101449]
MPSRVLITCAVTGNQTTPEMTPHLPITPQDIAEACLGAAEAGAAAVHIHVRDPRSGRPSMEIDYYRDVVARIRAKNTEVILNLTTGPGGRFAPDKDDPKIAGPGTTLMRPEDRVAHIALLKPDICTLDLNTMNSGKEVVINTPGNIRRMAAVIRQAGVKPEIELFDSGDIALCRDLVSDGTLDGLVLCSIVMGVKYGFQPSPETVLYARGLLPPGTLWTAFGTGRSAFPMVAQSYLAGGHVRVGLEDAIYLERGVLAQSNALMVEKARGIVEALGGEIATARQARDMLGLRERCMS